MKHKKVYIVILTITLLIILALFYIINKKVDFKSVIDNSIVYIEATNDLETKKCSGFVYDTKSNKAYIVTAYHCISDVSDIYVYNTAGKKEKAVIDTYNFENDIAILSINNNLSLNKINVSNRKLNIGDNIYVIGTPLDIKYIGTLTHGIISYVDREVSIKKSNGLVTYNTIQIDAPINSGNSGSVLVDDKGRAIGMVIIKDNNLDGISFAISINDIKRIIG